MGCLHPSAACCLRRALCAHPALPWPLPVPPPPRRMREAQAAGGTAAASTAQQQQPASKKQKSGTAQAWKAGVGYGHRWGAGAGRGCTGCHGKAVQASCQGGGDDATLRRKWLKHFHCCRGADGGAVWDAKKAEAVQVRAPAGGACAGVET